MFPRQARRSLSVQRAVSLRLSQSAPRSLLSQSLSSNLGRRCVVTSHYHPWRRRTSDANPSRVRDRNLATAVGDLYTDSIPYNYMNSSASMPEFPPQSLRSHSLQPFDPAFPIILPEPTTGRRVTRISSDGVPGEVDDLLPVFNACLHVGKLDRAALVLKRINFLGAVSPEERIVLHNQYLRASLKQIRSNFDRKQAEGLHKWYEIQIRNTNLPHTAETVACMLKASLLSERGSRLERLVNRYMGMAPGESGVQVLSMDDILSDQDLAVITEICPIYNLEAEEMDLFSEEQVSEEVAATAEANAEPKKPFAELIATPQRGEGLATLNKGLEFLRNLEHVDVSKLPLSHQQDIQLHLERDSISAAIERWRVENKQMQQRGVNSFISGSAAASGSTLTSHMASWLKTMEEKIREEFKLIEASEQKEKKSDSDFERCIYGPLIQQSKPERLAAVTILTVLNLGALTGADKGVTVSKLMANVAKLTQEDIQLQQTEQAQKARRKRKVHFDAQSADKPNNPSTTNSRASSNPNKPSTSTNSSAATTRSSKRTQFIEDSTNYQRAMEGSARAPWSLTVKAQVGGILLKLLLECAKMKVTKEDPVTGGQVSQFQPAFSHSLQIRKGRKTGIVQLNPHLVDQLKREPLGDYIAKHLPMIVEPRPWTSFSEGGFLESKVSFVRVKPGDIEQRLYTKEAIKGGDLETAFKGLDVLGKTAWRVNRDVLNVMTDAWNRGDELANIPPLTPDLPIPEEPDPSDVQAHRRWLRSVKAIENERSGFHSQRCFMNLQLEIARAFRNQTLYFPHNVDYRGRAYPIPTYLNHMGADHTRGLLNFSKGKELGERGLRWLKIHLANVYGLDKASFDEREAFAGEQLDNIRDSVANPLDGNRWWLKAEDPWQCLAACFELKAAMDLPDPTKFVSHLPIQQDGTCNGLQHYAALGGDSWGAKQVNLEPGEKPADVYSAVADLVKQAISNDAAAGLPQGKILDGKITRKVVKQTVMTNVYGVTFAGAKKQVCKQIDALYPTIGKDNDTENITLASYVARHIFTALATMFRGAHDIQYWLGEAGGRICRALTSAQLDQLNSEFTDTNVKGKGKKPTGTRGKAGLEELMKSFRSTVVWTTPLRMPVVQPYRKNTMKEVRTCLQSVVFPISDQADPVNRKKQLQGFPPNFIHSLDASHMLLSALKCNELGLEFAAVHDSFWTHAADVDVMNGVLRDAFIQIHEEDVVGRLAAEFRARHHGSLYLAHIDPSSPVAQKIKDLRANSKLTPKEELLLEHKRNTLRLSGNPWEVEAAKQIVTPASVYEDMAAAEKDVVISDEVKEIELGRIDSKEVERSSLADEMDEDSIEDDEDAAETETAVEASKPKKGAAARPMAIWLPLTLPEIPKKGDFDVTRLRESKYFFS